MNGNAIRPKSYDVLLASLAADLAACVKCGRCLAPCPVRQVSATESATLRGHLALLAGLQSGVPLPLDECRRALSLCVGCLACQPECHNGVDVANTLALRGLLLDPGLYERWQSTASEAHRSETIENRSSRIDLRWVEAIRRLNDRQPAHFIDEPAGLDELMAGDLPGHAQLALPLLQRLIDTDSSVLVACNADTHEGLHWCSRLYDLPAAAQDALARVTSLPRWLHAIGWQPTHRLEKAYVVFTSASTLLRDHDRFDAKAWLAMLTPCCDRPLRKAALPWPRATLLVNLTEHHPKTGTELVRRVLEQVPGNTVGITPTLHTRCNWLLHQVSSADRHRFVSWQAILCASILGPHSSTPEVA